MVCIYCGHKTDVTNSRKNKTGSIVWRRRTCKRCKAVFTTRESIDLQQSLRVQHLSPGTPLEIFHRDQIYSDILLALDHRPHKVSDATEITATAIGQILAEKPLQPIVHTSKIANVCFTTLQNFDSAAAVKYRSYRQKLWD